ncbi:GNAT family N-acetyltransferase [Arthrobacter sp. Soil782]|uniref:GNAT family N-acetyltransferase n=1 Tax=Arthrobacter sp. Soil782 TaxID=1736410 RepID=UPI003FA48151
MKNLFVNPTRRGEGVGAALCDWLEAKARTVGFDHIYLRSSCGWSSQAPKFSGWSRVVLGYKPSISYRRAISAVALKTGQRSPPGLRRCRRVGRSGRRCSQGHHRTAEYMVYSGKQPTSRE